MISAIQVLGITIYVYLGGLNGSEVTMERECGERDSLTPPCSPELTITCPISAGKAALGTGGSAMAVNLSRNGPALQDAYMRVVDEKSPTDWWVARRPEAGRGQGSQGARSLVRPVPAPHPGRCGPPASSPLAPPCVGRLNPAWEPRESPARTLC